MVQHRARRQVYRQAERCPGPGTLLECHDVLGPRSLQVRRFFAAGVLFFPDCGGGRRRNFRRSPWRLVVPFPPGGPLDIAGRIIGKELQERWGQSVVVENKPGSTIGPDFVVKSAPDGYTLMIISSTPLVTLPQLQKVPYDVLKDLVGVTQTTLLTYALVRESRYRHQFGPGPHRGRARAAPGAPELRERRQRLRPSTCTWSSSRARRTSSSSTFHTRARHPRCSR